VCTAGAPGGHPITRPRPADLTDGQDLIEYALLAAPISLGVTAAMMLVREQLI
jgi:hypothetical protein